VIPRTSPQNVEAMLDAGAEGAVVSLFAAQLAGRRRGAAPGVPSLRLATIVAGLGAQLAFSLDLPDRRHSGRPAPVLEVREKGE
jgi:hypothetical protein